ncbi:caspase family protein [Methyloceanibacter sp.]|uniref:caspase family protein n=1 Tax=Methyloceanibacter sp. TaxID=1965321 RepID=UPI003D6D2829
MRAGSRLILRIFAILCIVLAAAVSASPSLAQSQKLTNQCKDQSHLDQMIDACTKILAMRGLSGATRSISFYNRAQAWILRDEFNLALADYSETLKINYSTAFNYWSRGQLFSSYIGDQDRAIADYDEALRLEPKPDPSGYRVNRAGIFLDRGIARGRRGDTDGEMADYNEAIRLGPGANYATLYANRGVLWRTLGDYDRALADLDKAVKRDPKNAHSYATRATIWQFKGNLDRALADADQAIKLEKKSKPLYLSYRAEIYRYRDEFEASISDYDAALRDTPDFAMAYTGRGLTYEKMGNLTRALADFEKALTITKFSDSNKSAQETARARLAALNAGEPQQAASVPAPVTAQTASTPSEQLQGNVSQGRRVALVIGNSAYKAVPALTNPQHDAEAVAGALRKVGFDVVSVSSDATREQLIEALRQFADEAEKSDWAMVYYAGHGIEVGGTNYLIPVDAKLATDRDVQLEAVSIDQVLIGVEGAKKLKLIVMDACRDNPFIPQMRRTVSPQLTMGIQAADASGGTPAGTRSVGRGLAEVKPQGAMLVVFAAKHGQLALDGESANSPFATAFVQRVGTPGVEINKLIRLVRDDVMEATAGRQEPFTYGSLPGREDFFFVAGK